MTRREIREAYDRTYQQMQEIISEMGGEQKIPAHRKRKTRLYVKLRKLQQIEHRLKYPGNQDCRGKELIPVLMRSMIPAVVSPSIIR